MNHSIVGTMVVLAGLAVTTTAPVSMRVSPAAQTVRLTNDVLRDKIRGGWAGQTVGVTFGGPTEFRYRGTMIDDYTPIAWNDRLLKDSFEHTKGLYDDIYVDLTFVNVIEKQGLDASAAQFADAFAHAGYQLWHANQMARYNILRGMTPPASGDWRNNPDADDIDFQIESDFIGLMSPGMLGDNAFGSMLPAVTDDAGTPFAIIVIPVDDKLAVKASGK